VTTGWCSSACCLRLAGTCWVLTSASLITAFAPQSVSDPVDFLHVVVLSEQSWLFEAWLSLGGVLVAPVYRLQRGGHPADAGAARSACSAPC
jgi:hypothetical protein